MARPPDARVWRVVGDPLVPATGRGPLDGRTVAVKDVVAVEGFAIGAGVPAYLDESRPQAASAASLGRLLDAGASVRGIAQTDQFAYSIAGRNAAYGTPPNPAVPGAIPGGSSSGPASAVALGEADLGLATDTAGSIRVPASYQGLWGLRTTYGAVSRAGVLPLAPSFDTVGWLARDPAVLEAAALASLEPTDPLASTDPLAPTRPPGPLASTASAAGASRLVTAPALAASATPTVRAAFLAALAGWDSDVASLEDPALGDPALDALYADFRTVQAAEAWAAHGAWITAHPGALGADVAARFAWASTVGPGAGHAARRRLDAARRAIEDVLGDDVLVLPSAASVAPALDADGDEIEAVRAATLRMTSVAGVTGRPALSVPLLTVGGAPVGVCLVGPRGGDVALLALARELAAGTSRR
jgi:Asp-tRNA(Asn)/Glu-tRNA(Gln) amidotransferase A subunit family amidase